MDRRSLLAASASDNVMPIVLNAYNSSNGNSYTTPLSDNPNAKKLYEELMLLSNNTGEGDLDVGLVSICAISPYVGAPDFYYDVISYSLAPSYIAEGILLYKVGYSYYVLQQDGTMKSVFYD